MCLSASPERQIRQEGLVQLQMFSATRTLGSCADTPCPRSAHLHPPCHLHPRCSSLLQRHLPHSWFVPCVAAQGGVSWLTPPHPCSFSCRAGGFCLSHVCHTSAARDDCGFSLDTIHSLLLLLLHRAIFRQAGNLVLADFSEGLYFPKTLWSWGSQAPAVF